MYAGRCCQSVCCGGLCHGRVCTGSGQGKPRYAPKLAQEGLYHWITLLHRAHARSARLWRRSSRPTLAAAMVSWTNSTRPAQLAWVTARLRLALHPAPALHAHHPLAPSAQRLHPRAHSLAWPASSAHHQYPGTAPHPAWTPPPQQRPLSRGDTAHLKLSWPEHARGWPGVQAWGPGCRWWRARWRSCRACPRWMCWSASPWARCWSTSACWRPTCTPGTTSCGPAGACSR